MDMALRLAAADGQEPRLDWLGQEIRPEATGGTVILITAEDDADELAIRWNDIDPTGEMRQRAAGRLIAIPRSEEHTSELQSLMRISYSVFCFKKKNDIIPIR